MRFLQAGRRHFIFAAIVAGLACGGSSSGPAGPGGGGGGGGGGQLSATFNGTPWTADTAFVTASQAGVANYLIVLSALSTTRNLSLTLGNVLAPGTYPIGVDMITVFGGFAGWNDVVTPTTFANWQSPLNGVSGTVTITTLTTSRIVGTFAFVAESLPVGTSPLRNVTAGSFDIPFTPEDPYPTLSPRAGSTITGTVDGQPFAPFNVIALDSSVAGWIISAYGGGDSTLISLSSNFAPVVGTTSIDGLNTVFAATSGALTWGFSPSDTGSVTFTSVSANRATGSFSAELQPLGAATGTRIISGTFDVGLDYHPGSPAPPAFVLAVPRPSAPSTRH